MKVAIHRNVTYFLGVEDTKNKKEGEVETVAWKIHDQYTYNYSNPKYDAAIVTLKESVQFNYKIRPICLPKANSLYL